jgi:pilus assembly protein Flp/PilA
MIRYCMNYVSLKLKEQKGQGMVEYALLVALIAVVVIAGLLILGPIIKDKFIEISGELAPAAAPTTP